MFVPTWESVLDMSPTDFEKYCVQLLQEQSAGLENCIFQHNKIITVDDGNYQIDGFIEFSAMGVTYKTLVECKHYKNSISREKVQILYDKVRATGAQKGILMSISNFQSGAIDYATKHGIALIQIIESGKQFDVRVKPGTIVASSHIPHNNGCPYIGVLQYGKVGMTHCSYLRLGNMSLQNFLLNGLNKKHDGS
ncbi:restriction endonuclease [Desulfosporosinus sp. FKB]|uniref:restriction endonuclease n=1 Tax=Desulfosporosinus sp. FKB TaxID=1969835 RepID=UPI000B49883E|nr:restriction endonuclease [Desulfosporosinus sp. FKB]